MHWGICSILGEGSEKCAGNRKEPVRFRKTSCYRVLSRTPVLSASWEIMFAVEKSDIDVCAQDLACALGVTSVVVN